MEFDSDVASGKSTLIWIFQDGLKPSITAQMEQRRRENDSWEKLVKKAIETEAKIGLLPLSFIRDMDQRCSRGNRPATMSKSQTSSSQDLWDKPSSKKTTSSNKPLHSSWSENGDTSDKKARKKKKTKQRHRDAEQAGKNSTPATGVNVSCSANKTHPRRKDPSLITCYNCNKKGHYADHCSEPKKNVSKN